MQARIPEPCLASRLMIRKDAAAIVAMAASTGQGDKGVRRPHAVSLDVSMLSVK
ncbi:MAG: hypothetical protein OXL36_11390 [Bryobacterales bacterium]|nr:hypothetical protein [Bryobacterales bacterium]MDE0293142.1 hypothetical protein [Bryobacterales bacterium]